MKQKKHWFCLIIVLGFVLLLGTFLFYMQINYYKTNETYLKMREHSFIEENTIPIELPKGRLYLDKRLGSDDVVYLCNDLNWVFDCKLFQDFQWFHDSYCVYSSIDYIRINGGEKTTAYYQVVDGDRYIFVWEFSWPSIIHELAHFADDTHDGLSQNEEWKSIYQKEWKNNKWLQGYKKDSLSVDEQMNLFFKESFAEGFAMWYVSDYREKYYATYSEQQSEKNDILETVSNSVNAEVNKENYPLTYEYMERFYAQYAFSDEYLRAVEYDLTSPLNWD